MIIEYVQFVVFCAVTLCSHVGGYRYFGRILELAENGSSMFLRKVSTHLQYYMVSQRGIPQSEQFYNENFMYVVQVQ
jgi:hypothetical protein